MHKLVLILTIAASTAVAVTMVKPTSIESSMPNTQYMKNAVPMPTDFNSKYLSELYLMRNQKYAKDVGSYCTDNKSSSQIELVNCNTALKVTNVWYKFYTYSGVILNNMLGFINTICLFSFIFLIFILLKDIRKTLRSWKSIFTKINENPQ